MNARGYIGAGMRELRCVPQNVQNATIRQFCQKKGFQFLLSAVEYNTPDSTFMFDEIVEDVIVLYSMLQMPRRKEKRLALKKQIFFAAENLKYTPELEETFDLMELIYAGSKFSTINALQNAA